MGHGRPGGVGLYVVLINIFLLVRFSAAIEDVHTKRPLSEILRRGDAEHVVLARCLEDGDASKQSFEAAYYEGSPDSTPDDTTTVASQGDQSNIWANTTASALFNNTGVTFTSKLGPEGNDGDFAGTGSNVYAPFNCWQKAQDNLYSQAGRSCSMVYDCNHDAAPGAASSTSSASSTSPTSSTRADASKSTGSDNLSVGAIVGVSIGIGVGVLLIASAAFYLVRRHRRSKRAKLADLHAPLGKGPRPSKFGDTIKVELPAPQPVHELYGYRDPAEVHGQDLRRELDGIGVEPTSVNLPPGYHT